MKNKILLMVVIILSVVFINKRSSNNTSFFNDEITIFSSKDENYITLDINDYLIGVLAAEMPASFETEALKAQAIASRTYAYYKKDKLTTDKTTQSYITISQMKEKWQKDFNKYYEKIKEAVLSTNDIVLTYDNKIISAYYFAMSNGFTEDAMTVFGENKSYLTSVVSSEDTNNRNYKVFKKMSIDDFANKLKITKPVIINEIIKNNTDHVEKIIINNKSYSGIEIRKLLELRSTDFEFEIQDESINITTYGYGHGVGMSQYGANNLAKLGYAYDEILKHYYQNVQLTSIKDI